MGKRIMISNHNSNRNNKKQLFSGITKTSPTKIIIKKDNETSNNTVIDNTDQNTQTMKINIKNLHFGDGIGQDPQEHSTRIFSQDVHGLELSTTSHTLLTMRDKQIDIACLAERNTNWNHYKGKRQLNRIILKQWKRAHLTTSNIENKVTTLYQPRGTAIISTNKTSPRITDNGVDP